MMFDSHAHVHFLVFDTSRAEVLQRSKEKQMVINLVGTQKETSAAAVALAETADWLYASIGTHPGHVFPTHVDTNESTRMTPEQTFDRAFYDELARSKKVIAVGECGLDLYHLPKDVPVDEVLRVQTAMFLAHVDFALAHDLPLVIHCRDAHDEMLAILEALPVCPRGTIHCYTGNWAHAERYLALGFYLGFTGVITFPAKKTNPEPQVALQEVVARIPLDRILVETDAPYLAPQAYRGEQSEPWMVEEVLVYIATARQIPVSTVVSTVFTNSCTLFRVGT